MERFFPMLIEIIYFYNPNILKIDNFLIAINIFQLCMERTSGTNTIMKINLSFDIL